MKFKVGDAVWCLNFPLKPIVGTVTTVNDIFGYKVAHVSHYSFLDKHNYSEHELFAMSADKEALIHRLKDVIYDMESFCEKLEAADGK